MKVEYKGNLIRAAGDAKTSKSLQKGYLQGIMYMSPSDLSGFGNVCPMAEIAGCKNSCLNTAGRGAMGTVQKGRLRKTKWFFEDRQSFMLQLCKDIRGLVEYARRKGLTPCVRLNGTSDIQWERIKFTRSDAIPNPRTIFEMFPSVQFLDYTKIYKRFDRPLPHNYHLSLSYSEHDIGYARQCLNYHYQKDVNLVMVVRNKEKALLKWSNSVDGDKHDLRFLDPRGSKVILSPKGKAKKEENNGFVITV